MPVDIVHAPEPNKPFHLQLPPSIPIATLTHDPLAFSSGRAAAYLCQAGYATIGIGGSGSLNLRLLYEVEQRYVRARRVPHDVDFRLGVEPHRADVAGNPAHCLGEVVHLTQSSRETRG